MLTNVVRSLSDVNGRCDLSLTLSKRWALPPPRIRGHLHTHVFTIKETSLCIQKNGSHYSLLLGQGAQIINGLLFLLDFHERGKVFVTLVITRRGAVTSLVSGPEMQMLLHFCCQDLLLAVPQVNRTPQGCRCQALGSCRHQ